MAKVLNCECGFHGARRDGRRARANAPAPIDQDHPDLIGKRSREDILAAAEEV
ncbi:MAG: hypothetical protein ACRDUY_11030 [Nitriliruptorales bacterium]